MKDVPAEGTFLCSKCTHGAPVPHLHCSLCRRNVQLEEIAVLGGFEPLREAARTADPEPAARKSAPGAILCGICSSDLSSEDFAIRDARTRERGFSDQLLNVCGPCFFPLVR
jgi:hypothetical protein